MKPAMIPNATAVAGESQGYVPLPYRLSTFHNTVTGRDVPGIAMRFKPSVDEVMRLFAGEEIELSLMFLDRPVPMLLDVVAAVPEQTDVTHSNDDIKKENESAKNV